jgi:plasmid stability protein
MPVNLSIKEVPDLLADALRRRAERHHRSLQGELMAIIESVVTQESAMRAESQRVRVGAETRPRAGKNVEQVAAEQLARFPEPITGGPLAADILRADRDRR